MVLGVIGLLLIGGIGLINSIEDNDVKNNMEQIYSGPVPLGYDVEHFRETGETIKEVEK